MTDQRIDFTPERNRFLNGHTEHAMTVLHDDGLYRHIRFQRPNTGLNRFDLVTWPGYLAITGDVESFTFARVPDMFEFFGGRIEYINPSYWAEKVIAGHPTEEFSEEKFKTAVVQEFWDARHHFPGESVPLFQRLREDVLNDEVTYYEQSAMEAMRDFQYRGRTRTFEFTDWWEMDLKVWSSHYLHVCHAIPWGIAKYRAEVTA